MKTKMIWANLAVADLNRTTQFYTQLGFKPNGSSGELTSFIFGENNFIIHFFLKEKFEQALNTTAADLQYCNEIQFSLAAESKEEVELWAEEVRKAGGKILSDPAPLSKGYNCDFTDPDGHRFNVLFWPR